MNPTLHITSGDCAGASLAKAGLAGEIFVWHDLLYDGPTRPPGWPDEQTMAARARFLEETTGGGLGYDLVLETMHRQYRKLAAAGDYASLVLWFDACLFDQAMLAHLLACLQQIGAIKVDILCVDAFPGIDPFHGLGQLQPQQLASLVDRRRPATDAQFRFAVRVDEAFASQEPLRLAELSTMANAPLPWVPAAVARWRQEQPGADGLGQLERLALAAIRRGCRTPAQIFAAVAAADTPPQFWGDTTLWQKINGLAERQPPLLHIDGPAARLPQWISDLPLDAFTITALP